MTLSRGTGPEWKGPAPLWKRHWEAFRYVFRVVLPTIFRTGKRPVIFAKYSGIGDIICTFPAALELKKRHPDGEFIYNCGPDYSCLPKLGGVTEHTTSFRYIGLVGFWYRFLLSGFYSFASDDDRPGRDHAELYIKDYGRSFGIELKGDHPRLRHEAAVTDRVKALLEKDGLKGGPLIVIHTGPSWPVKEWPHGSWVNLAGELRLQGYDRIVRLGTNSHPDYGEMDLEEIPGVVSFVNQLTLEESAALIELSDLLIGIDSGLLHIAVAVGTPAVGLWGATSPQFLFSTANQRRFVISQVECQGCHHRVPRLHWMTGCPFDIKCMKAIGVEEVLKTCQTALGVS